MKMVKVLKMSTGFVWLGSSVVECTHGKRKTLGSSPDRATFFFRPCDIWWPMCGDQFVTGRSCGSVAQWLSARTVSAWGRGGGEKENKQS